MVAVNLEDSSGIRDPRGSFPAIIIANTCNKVRDFASQKHVARVKKCGKGMHTKRRIA